MIDSDTEVLGQKKEEKYIRRVLHMFHEPSIGQLYAAGKFLMAALQLNSNEDFPPPKLAELIEFENLDEQVMADWKCVDYYKKLQDRTKTSSKQKECGVNILADLVKSIYGLLAGLAYLKSKIRSENLATTKDKFTTLENKLQLGTKFNHKILIPLLAFSCYGVKGLMTTTTGTKDLTTMRLITFSWMIKKLILKLSTEETIWKRVQSFVLDLIESSNILEGALAGAVREDSQDHSWKEVVCSTTDLAKAFTTDFREFNCLRFNNPDAFIHINPPFLLPYLGLTK